MHESIRASRTLGLGARTLGVNWRASNVRRRRAARLTAGLLAATLLSLTVARAAPTQRSDGCPVRSQELASVSNMSTLRGRSAEAMNEAYALMMRCPKDASAWFALAQVEDRSGLKWKARASLAKAFSLDPSGSFAPRAQVARVRHDLHSFELEISAVVAVLMVALISLLVAVAVRVRRAAKGRLPDAPSGTIGHE